MRVLPQASLERRGTARRRLWASRISLPEIGLGGGRLANPVVIQQV